MAKGCADEEEADDDDGGGVWEFHFSFLCLNSWIGLRGRADGESKYALWWAEKVFIFSSLLFVPYFFFFS